MKTKFTLLEELSFGKRVFLSFLFTLFFIISSAQTIGDFRSKASGNWTSPATWERCTSISPTVWAVTTEYPGSAGGSGNYAVTVTAGTTVTVTPALSVGIGNLYVEGTLELKANFTLTGGAKTIGVTNGLILFEKKVEFRLPQGTVFSMDIADSILQGLHGFTPPDKEECDANTAVMIWNPNIKPNGGYDRYTTCVGQPGTTGLNFADFNNSNAGIKVLASNGFSKAFCAFPISNNVVFRGALTVKGDPNPKVTYLWQYYPPGSNVLSPLPTGISSSSNSLTINSTAPLTVEGVYTFRLIFKYETLTRYADFYLYNGASSVWDGTTWSYGAPTDLYPLKAVIETNYNTGATGSFSACSCTVNTGKLITISPSTYVKVRDNITNNGSIIVESDGNLIQESATGIYSGGTFKAKRAVTKLRNNPGPDPLLNAVDYVFWSSPVSGQNLQSFSPLTPSNRIYQYNEANDFFIPAAANFVKGKGYAIRAESGPTDGTVNGYDKTYEFLGPPNNGDITVPINRSPNSGAIVRGYNLVGNPYPSNINFDELYNLNSTIIEPKVYFWTNKTYTAQQGGSSYDGSNYVVYTKGGSNSAGVDGLIKVGQGFIVQKTSFNSGTLTFKNMNGIAPIRVATTGTFYQKNSGVNRFWLKLTAPNKVVNSQMIGYFEGATNEFDNAFDAESMTLTSDLFYSTLEDKRLIVQGRAEQFKKEDRVQLGANFYQDGTYTIDLQQPEGIFSAYQKIYLKDKENGKLIDLSEGSYTFQANKGISEGRFEIVYKPEVVLGTDSALKENLVIYRDGDDFIVQSKSEKITMLDVYDATGRIIYQLTPNSTKVIVDASKMNNGIYILKINQGGRIKIKKVIR